MTPSLNCGPLRQEWLRNTLYQMKFAHGNLGFYSAYGKYLHRFLFSGSTGEWYFWREDGMSDSGEQVCWECAPWGTFMYSTPKSGETDPWDPYKFPQSWVHMISLPDGSRYIVLSKTQSEKKKSYRLWLVSKLATLFWETWFAWQLLFDYMQWWAGSPWGPHSSN